MKDIEPLLKKAAAGDREAFDHLFGPMRAELRSFVEVRMEQRLRKRLDASDVVQETQLEAFERLKEFVERRPMPFRAWLHKTAHQRLIKARRHHLKTDKRAAHRDQGLPDHTSAIVARHLVVGGMSPSQELSRRETEQRVGAALDRLPDVDREILLMRTIDGLSTQEAACILDIDQAAARKRYGRALIRLKKLLFEDGMGEG